MRRTKPTQAVLFFGLMILGIFMSTKLTAQSIRPEPVPPKVVGNPASTPLYAKQNRKFTGISSMVVTKGGVIWATWYAGLTPGEDANNYVVLAVSTDHGDSWEEVLVIDPDEDGPIRAFDPEIWIDPDQKIWLFWSQSPKEAGKGVFESGVPTLWTMQTYQGESRNAVWSRPAFLTDGVMMCKPTVLSGGEWVLPVSTWRSTRESAKAVISVDKGESWQVSGAVDVPDREAAYDEHMIVERKDGSLWMLIRTRSGLGESFSFDKGATWTAFAASNIAHTSSRFFISKLVSGNLLLVKHGPIAKRTGRSHLMAFVSEDDGKSWSEGLLLDERPGVSYPDGHQTEDGRIYITYDFNRTKDQHILMTHFREEDVTKGRSDEKVVEVFTNRKLISEGGPEKPKEARTIHFPKVQESVLPHPKKENVWVFMLAGQSNMAGRGLVEPSDTIPDSRIFTISSSGELIYAKAPLHFYEKGSEGLDCGISFARTLIRQVPDSVRILLIPAAVGGSSIGQWVNDSTFRNVVLLSNFYEKMGVAKRYGVLKGILWHQGESDAKEDRIGKHEEQMRLLFGKFRARAKDSSIPVFVGELGPFLGSQWHRAINTTMKEYVESDPNAYWVTTKGLSHKGDEVHFDSHSLRELGRRYAELYLKR